MFRRIGEYISLELFYIGRYYAVLKYTAGYIYYYAVLEYINRYFAVLEYISRYAVHAWSTTVGRGKGQRHF